MVKVADSLKGKNDEVNKSTLLYRVFPKWYTTIQETYFIINENQVNNFYIELTGYLTDLKNLYEDQRKSL